MLNNHEVTSENQRKSRKCGLINQIKCACIDVWVCVVEKGLNVVACGASENVGKFDENCAKYRNVIVKVNERIFFFCSFCLFISNVVFVWVYDYQII